jgi:hypothetical protein
MSKSMKTERTPDIIPDALVTSFCDEMAKLTGTGAFADGELAALALADELVKQWRADQQRAIGGESGDERIVEPQRARRRDPSP